MIGAGHAGCEAALAGARLGLGVCIFTMNTETIGQLSCNPAIGGLAKGHLVREIDALGGEMARAADAASIQSRVLNRSKGPAVWSLRAQADRALYKTAIRGALEAQPGLDIVQATVEGLVVDGGKIKGVLTSTGVVYEAKAVIVTTGTFLKGLMHIGLESRPGGRAGDLSSVGLSNSLRELGLKMGRLKTGTPPRLGADSIDFSRAEAQYGDDPPPPFSYSTKAITNPQLPCYITYTNPDTHKIITDNLDRSPLYGGKIKGIGPRYCPSVEDKVVRFAHRPRHQVFLEPEGLDSNEYYANGISTSLPQDVQVRLVRSIPALEEAEIVRPGYAVEYDYVFPTQINHTLETKLIEGLFLAGQINGTSGYEEAAAQGLMAGINASLKILERQPLVLGRQEAYTGVLIDDLVTKGTGEPYRMFTSRAEYRLLLRHDNADLRLREKGFTIGLVPDDAYERFKEKCEAIASELQRIRRVRVKPEAANPALAGAGSTPIAEAATLEQLLKRPEVDYSLIEGLSPPERELDDESKKQVQTETKYAGYIQRQMEAAGKLRRSEAMKIPPDFDYRGLKGLKNEEIAKLEEIRPQNLGQAGRIPGVTPAALTLIMLTIKRDRLAGK